MRLPFHWGPLDGSSVPSRSRSRFVEYRLVSLGEFRVVLGVPVTTVVTLYLCPRGLGVSTCHSFGPRVVTRPAYGSRKVSRCVGSEVWLSPTRVPSLRGFRVRLGTLTSTGPHCYPLPPLTPLGLSRREDSRHLEFQGIWMSRVVRVERSPEVRSEFSPWTTSPKNPTLSLEASDL